MNSQHEKNQPETDEQGGHGQPSEEKVVTEVGAAEAEEAAVDVDVEAAVEEAAEAEEDATADIEAVVADIEAAEAELEAAEASEAEDKALETDPHPVPGGQRQVRRYTKDQLLEYERDYLDLITSLGINPQ